MKKDRIKTSINSEIGALECVITHTPGAEVENMTPENAERALYSDILNLSVALPEYNEFNAVLKRFAQVFEVRDLLAEILENNKVRNSLLSKICRSEHRRRMRNARHPLTCRTGPPAH